MTNNPQISRRAMLKTAAAAFMFPLVTAMESSDETMDVQEINADVCIIGGGSGGIGAALAASRNGSKVVLVEKNSSLGGTSTLGLVCNWEPGPGDDFALEIYRNLKQQNAVGITSDHNADRSKGPFGLWLSTPGLEYSQSLRRANLHRSQWHSVVFNPDSFHNVVKTLLNKTGNCRIMFNTQLTRAEAHNKRVVSVAVKSADGRAYVIKASNFIDSTGGGYLCRMIGCKSMLGIDSKSQFNEPSAPDQPQRVLNAISLCYRIRESGNPVRQKPPRSSVSGWVKSAHVTTLPGGGLIVNPLAMLPGIALLDMGYQKAMDECKKRVQAHWHWLQSFDTFAGSEFESYAFMLGVRESYRIVGEYVLTQHDLLAGINRQEHDDIIAYADHAMDIHGQGGKCGELSNPYGIPYRCLIPRGWKNLLVACRGASFSHIAASSCRLSRTMMALGHAAGMASSMSAQEQVDVRDIDIKKLQDRILT